MVSKSTMKTVKELVKLARGKGTDASIRTFLLSKQIKDVYTGDEDKNLNILDRVNVVLDRIEDDYEIGYESNKKELSEKEIDGLVDLLK